jgi:hypothetical protein
VIVSVAAVLGLAVGGTLIMMGEKPLQPGAPGERLALGPEKRADVAMSSAEEGYRTPIENLRGKEGRAGGAASPSPSDESSGDATESTETPARATAPGTIDSHSSLLAMASFEQKLSAGMGTAAARTHAFKNETVRLRIPVRNKRERDAVVARLVAYLGERNAVDLGKASQAGFDTRAGAGALYYYKGNPRTNFEAADEEQFLVRAPRRELAGMLDELSTVTSSTDAVALVAGPISIRGLERVRMGLYGLPAAELPAAGLISPETQDDMVASLTDAADLAESRSTDEPTPRGGRLFDGLRKLIRIDADTLARMTEAEDDTQPDGSPAPHTATRDMPKQSEATKGRQVASAEAGPRDIPPHAVSRKVAPDTTPNVGDSEGEHVSQKAASAQSKKRKTETRRSRRMSGRGATDVGGRTGAKVTGPEADDEFPSLVDRRLKKIEKRRRNRREAYAPGAGNLKPGRDAALAKQAADALVTLVVQVVVVKPAPGPTTKPPPAREGPARKKRRERPTKPADAE